MKIHRSEGYTVRTRCVEERVLRARALAQLQDAEWRDTRIDAEQALVDRQIQILVAELDPRIETQADEDEILAYYGSSSSWTTDMDAALVDQLDLVHFEQLARDHKDDVADSTSEDSISEDSGSGVDADCGSDVDLVGL